MSDPLAAPLARLHAEGRLRVWSLAVTIFGDAAAPRGGALSMADLTRLLARLGAEPGAVRTAMSRLARDGWVERRRAGRRSYYSLAPRGLDESLAAAPRIYAAEPPEWDGRWTIAFTADGEAPAGFRRIAPGAWIAPGDAPCDAPGVFAIRGGRGAPPDWARAALSPPPLAARYAALSAAWAGFAPPGEPEAAMAARTLLIHDWRRTLLRDAPLPRALRPAGWPGAAARALVARLYHALLPASEAWLDGCEAAPGESPPPAGPALLARFGGPSVHPDQELAAIRP